MWQSASIASGAAEFYYSSDWFGPRRRGAEDIICCFIDYFIASYCFSCWWRSCFNDYFNVFFYDSFYVYTGGWFCFNDYFNAFFYYYFYVSIGYCVVSCYDYFCRWGGACRPLGWPAARCFV